MPTVKTLQQELLSGAYDPQLAMLYGQDALEEQRARYGRAAAAFLALYGDRPDARFYSAPGRTELIGNHTDHNLGQVLAASVSLDIVAVAAPNGEDCIRVQSEGYPADMVTLDDLSPRGEEVNHSASLIRGTAARFRQLGHAAGGFDAYTVSDVPKGSGLSSSAAFEVLIGVILNDLYNGAALSAPALARIAQYTENTYFGKPSGLMDQTASAVGGIISIDFAEKEKPLIQAVDVDLSSSRYSLCIVETGGSHADLTREYAAVTEEMGAVASALGVKHLRETSREVLLAALPRLRETVGDRAILRSLHFFDENQRVAKGVEALRAGDLEGFKRQLLRSGHSSFEYLQNIYASSLPRFQGLSLALCLAQGLLEGQGAWRVHGGGFGGTTLNLVPEELTEEFRTVMENAFGPGCCHFVRIRSYGGVRLDTIPSAD